MTDAIIFSQSRALTILPAHKMPLGLQKYEFMYFCKQMIEEKLTSMYTVHFTLEYLRGGSSKPSLIVGAWYHRALRRARWNCQNQNHDPPHMYFNVKFNFKVSLFSSIFWFERSFRSGNAILVFGPCLWENASKTITNMRFFKIGLKPTQKC